MKCPCGTHACFNNPDEKTGICCSKCKSDNMVDIKSKKCITCNITRPTFNSPGKTVALYCNGCALPGMVDIKSKKCKTHLCDTRPSTKYKGYCTRCFIHLFPDEKISTRYRTKERHIADYIRETFPDLEILFNTTVGGCSKRRPDIFIEQFTHSIIIEVDEDQHKSYDTTCEIARLNELYTDLGDRPIKLIRFNPDSYIKNKRKIPPLFKQDKKDNNLLLNNDEWAIRSTVLKSTIEKYTKITDDTTVKVEYLFFDKA